MKEPTFLGESFDFWVEIKRRLDKGSGKEGSGFTERDLLYEVSSLRKRCSFYESRIKQMVAVMEDKEI